MNLKLRASQSHSIESKKIKITGSKSESNRLLILQQQYPNLQIRNLSNSDDTVHLTHALESTEETLDIGHAGTAMRFLTAFLANQTGRKTVLTGSKRMKERPIGILVDALRYLGAQIDYVENEGYPPLLIHGKSLKGGEVTMDAGVSSQYLSALLLIGAQMENGLHLRLSGELTSRPYLEMTTTMLQEIGLNVNFEDQHIEIKPQNKIEDMEVTVESDWSSAGYWYGWVALQPEGYSVQLSAYKEVSLQGDAQLSAIYKKMGVRTQFGSNEITLTKIKDFNQPQHLEFDLTEQPDQAQTIFATCLGLGIDLKMTGLHTLRIKETDRIAAMEVEGTRFRESEITTTDDTLEIHFPEDGHFNNLVRIDTYNDHRMALAFAPLCLKTDLIINDAGVVSKSYGDYWDDLKSVNVDITEI
ncbi:3-phosphoshikimate 1-carboxyvinyltransferase [Nonlabens sp. Hel1_33_55]|uniref:3-phosphoshikimate 1-carboxyvinyltransferase n=1 Tax=Nonlabens sp. Hel1_33_55 TaxID=1336802 RepID=UPI000875D420|nr:3-phosphoshikimate 1-carboxyvinyltransferase [Nonlabens sp. Hel1_33_55]SCY43769.1 3-phosphoshikimate 1-carboxyvinyltransferase [Nonlabens sp. Hel1_33_55]